jgi:glucokinase
MNTKIVMSMDVGGTNTRIQFGKIRNNDLSTIFLSPILRKELTSVKDLCAFGREALKEYGDKPDLLVVDCAGPVSGHKTARITNWPEKPAVSSSDLAELGFPESDITILNDMEALSYGVAYRLVQETIPISSYLCLPLGKVPEFGNLVVIAPGTGLGSAGVVCEKKADGRVRYHAVPGESQHAAAPALDEQHGAWIRKLTEERNDGTLPRWEDFVSGSGLERTFRFLAGDGAGKGKTAAEIASCAAAGSDEKCVQALNYYYRLLGRFCQQMGLAFMAHGGVFLSGSNIAKNIDFFLRQGSFIKEFRNNYQVKFLVDQFPVCVIGEGLNLHGNFYFSNTL